MSALMAAAMQQVKAGILKARGGGSTQRPGSAASKGGPMRQEGRSGGGGSGGGGGSHGHGHGLARNASRISWVSIPAAAGVEEEEAGASVAGSTAVRGGRGALRGREMGGMEGGEREGDVGTVSEAPQGRVGPRREG